MAMPWPGSRIAERINKIALSQQIGKALAAKNMKQPILWASLPTALPAVGELGERAVVYYCGDDFGALADVDHEPVLEMEQRLVAKADLILAASPTLAERFPREKTMYLPHGVDVSLFSTPSPRAHDLPSGQPVAGFYGSLSDWIDVDLLATVAQRLPEWRFVFIGDVRTDVTALMRCANVQLLGARPHAELSRYSQHWSASMLPFRNCPQITACNPLKLREYLAAGRPLVSTSFPALGPYATLIHEANTPDTFAAALVHSCNEGAEQAAARRASIAGESWDVRAEAVANALRNL
jgi:glycosyltransferase involved in cell wall biosynthesis